MKETQAFLLSSCLAHCIKTYSEAIVQYIHMVSVINLIYRKSYYILFKVQGTVRLGGV